MLTRHLVSTLKPDSALKLFPRPNPQLSELFSMNKILSYIAVSGAAVLGTTAGLGLWQLFEGREKSLLYGQGSSAQCTSATENEQIRHKLTHRSSAFTSGISEAISRSRKLIQRAMLEQGIPGAQIAVSKNGCLVWSEGLGLADVENSVPCSPDSVMRIASISKSLTTVGLMQLWEKRVG